MNVLAIMCSNIFVDLNNGFFELWLYVNESEPIYAAVVCERDFFIILDRVFYVFSLTELVTRLLLYLTF